jgi:hypothetical protein
MAAPKGNKFAVCPENTGRPRKYNLEKEAQDLLEFIKRDDCLSLEDFTNDKEYLSQELSGFAQGSEVFALALKKAKEVIGRRREDFVSKGRMNSSVWNRSARLYSKNLKEEEEHEKDLDLNRKMKLIEYEYKMKSSTSSNITEEAQAHFNQLMTQFTLSQSQSQRKIVDNKIINEQ